MRQSHTKLVILGLGPKTVLGGRGCPKERQQPALDVLRSCQEITEDPGKERGLRQPRGASSCHSAGVAPKELRPRRSVQPAAAKQRGWCFTPWPPPRKGTRRAGPGKATAPPLAAGRSAETARGLLQRTELASGSHGRRGKGWAVAGQVARRAAAWAQPRSPLTVLA